MTCPSLIDTGSQVTTISKSFLEEHLDLLPVYPVTEVIRIRGAGGQDVPFLGYIEARLTLQIITITVSCGF